MFTVLMYIVAFGFLVLSFSGSKVNRHHLEQCSGNALGYSPHIYPLGALRCMGTTRDND
jgi:hypothetical protein